MPPPAVPTVPVPSSPVAAPRKKSSRTLVIALASVVAVAVAAVAAYFGFKREKPTAVTTEKAMIKTITHLVTATGKVQPEIEVKISPEVAGELIEIPVKEGQTVKKGDLLVKIKPDFYQAQLEQQEAGLASARAVSLLSKARLDKAEQDFKQSNDIYQKQLISEADYTAAKTNLSVARADYESSLAQIRRTEGSLSQARDQLSKTTIYSPVDGTLSSLTSEVGERVVGTGTYAGTEIMRIADLDHMEVRVKVNENDIVNVKVGDRTLITIDAFTGRKFEGSVSEISNSALATGGGQSSLAASASDEVTNFLVKIRITDRSVRLRPGMSATVDIETETVKDVVAAPIQSVTVRAAGGKTSAELQQERAKEAKARTGNELELVKEREDARRGRDKLQRVVFIKQGGAVKMRRVETGIADNTHIEITSGLKAGEEVVSGTYAAISRLLKDGANVVIEKPKKDEKK